MNNLERIFCIRAYLSQVKILLDKMYFYDEIIIKEDYKGVTENIKEIESYISRLKELSASVFIEDMKKEN